MGNIESVSYTDYDKITDTIIYLSDLLSLKFSVVLAKNASRNDKTRKHMHSEFVYPSKYIGTDYSRSLLRTMNLFYFVIDIKNDFAGSIVLSPGDIEMLKIFMDQKVIPWYFGQNPAFQIKDGMLYLSEYGEPAIYTQSAYKYIGFEPIVLVDENKECEQGLRLFVNNRDTICDLDMETFMKFVNIIKNTDMYGAACSLVNYVKCPPYGLNEFKNSGLGSGGAYRNSYLDNAKKR